MKLISSPVVTKSALCLLRLSDGRGQLLRDTLQAGGNSSGVPLACVGNLVDPDNILVECADRGAAAIGLFDDPVQDRREQP